MSLVAIGRPPGNNVVRCWQMLSEALVHFLSCDTIAKFCFVDANMFLFFFFVYDFMFHFILIYVLYILSVKSIVGGIKFIEF